MTAILLGVLYISFKALFAGFLKNIASEITNGFIVNGSLLMNGECGCSIGGIYKPILLRCHTTVIFLSQNCHFPALTLPQFLT